MKTDFPYSRSFIWKHSFFFSPYFSRFTCCLPMRFWMLVKGNFFLFLYKNTISNRFHSQFICRHITFNSPNNIDYISYCLLHHFYINVSVLIRCSFVLLLLQFSDSTPHSYVTLHFSLYFIEEDEKKHSYNITIGCIQITQRNRWPNI